MLVGRNKKYKGPKSHQEVMKVIRGEIAAFGVRLSQHRVNKMLMYFFSSRYGIGSYMKDAKIFTIERFGSFVPSEKFKEYIKARNLKRKQIIREKTRGYVAKHRAKNKIPKD